MLLYRCVGGDCLLELGPYRVSRPTSPKRETGTEKIWLERTEGDADLPCTLPEG
jgi:hypothetical protein